MEDSAGSADNEMSIAADSIEFKLNKLSQTWVSFAQDTLSQNSLKGTISLLTGLSQTLTGILGVIQTSHLLGEYYQVVDCLETWELHLAL